MIAVPGDTEPTTPELPIVATLLFPLLQVPLGVVIPNVVGVPLQIVFVPDMEVASVTTATVFVTKHPPGMVYEITGFPCNTAAAVTTPVFIITAAINGLLDVQEPPGIRLVNESTCELHIELKPEMVDGKLLTVTL